MPRRRRQRHGLVALSLAAAAVAAAGCQADLGTAGCQITQQVTLPGSRLTLLHDVRLDVIGPGYALMAYDAGANAVRWATLDASGTLGLEHAYGLPPNVQNPLFAMAAAPPPVQTPGGGDAILTGPVAGDTVLIGYMQPDSTGTKGELDVIAVPADGSAPAAPPSILLEFPNGVPPASSVAMVSSRTGLHAALAWIDDQLQRVMYAAVDGAGAKLVSPTPVGSGLPGFHDLAFTAGKADDATILYYCDDVNANHLTGPGWIIAEANASGGIDSTITLAISRQSATNPGVLTPTADGYALAWQEDGGAWLATYTAATQKLMGPYAFAPSTGFGGTLLQPPLVGVTTVASDDFGVLFQEARAAELWRLGPMAERRSGALIFPSVLGDIGTVSAVYPPGSGGGLAATYADYSGSDAASDQAGDRLFVTATCY